MGNGHVLLMVKLNLQCPGHDEESDGEAETDDEDTGHHQLYQQPSVQGQSRLEIFLYFTNIFLQKNKKYFLFSPRSSGVAEQSCYV